MSMNTVSKVHGTNLILRSLLNYYTDKLPFIIHLEVPLHGLVDVPHELVELRYLEHDLRVVPHDGLQLEKGLQGVLVEAQLLVAEPQVVEGLHAAGVVLQGHIVQLLGLLDVALVLGDCYKEEREGKMRCELTFSKEQFARLTKAAAL